MGRSPTGARVADGLTLARLGIAIALVPATWVLALDAVALLLSAAWFTDVADGRVARASGRPGRLGRWDYAVDAAVGAGLVIGAAGAGVIPTWVAFACVGAFGWLVAVGNLAGGMLLQLSGYLPVGVLLWTQRPALWLLPFATVGIIAVLDWRRLAVVQVPAFFAGVTEAMRRRPH